MKYSKLKNIGALLFLVQLFVVGLWFYIQKPTMDYSIAMLKIIPLLFGINLFFGLFLYVFKKKEVAILIFGNAILLPFIFFAGWILWFTYYAQ